MSRSGGGAAAGLHPAFAVAKAVLLVAYPALVYLGLTRWGPRVVAVAVAAAVTPRAVAAMRSSDPAVRKLLVLPVLVATLAIASAVIEAPRLLLAMPTLANAGMLAVFATSLRDTPMAERFARLQVPDLPPAEQAYCRSVTVAWCAFFTINGSFAAILACWAPLRWWALYTGAIAYGLVGLGFAIEYITRVYRFRRFGRGPIDRTLARLIPVSRRAA